MKVYLLLILLVSSHTWAQENIDRKLERHFQSLESLQKIISDQILLKSQHISREELNALITIEFTEEEIEEIRNRQMALIKEAKEKAELNSTVSIDLFRNDRDKVKSFCQALPKGAMLHVHPDGTMDRTTVKELLEQANPKINGPYLKKTAVDEAGFVLYPEEITFLMSLTPTERYGEMSLSEQTALQELFFLPPQPYSHDFSRFMSFFFIKGIVHRREDGDRNASADKIYRDFFKRAKDQKVIYVEFTASIQSQPWAIEQLKHWAEIGKEYGITARWNISFYRNNDAHKNELEMKKWITFLKSLDEYPELISGIDMLADESQYPALEQGQGLYVQALNAELPLKRTMHAGELGHKHNVRDAMILGVNRIGHGVKLWEDPLTLEFARIKELPIEINLVSNIRLQVVNDLNKHPFLNFLRLGLPISLSTDDEGLFETTMNKECEEAITHSDIQYNELKQMSFNGILTGFIDEETKLELLQVLQKQFAQFEKSIQ